MAHPIHTLTYPRAHRSQKARHPQRADDHVEHSAVLHVAERMLAEAARWDLQNGAAEVCHGHHAADENAALGDADVATGGSDAAQHGAAGRTTTDRSMDYVDTAAAL